MRECLVLFLLMLHRMHTCAFASIYLVLELCFLLVIKKNLHSLLHPSSLSRDLSLYVPLLDCVSGGIPFSRHVVFK